MMTTEERIRYIEERIHAELQPLDFDIADESHLHAGHASAKGGGHFRVRIVAAAFVGKTPLQRHRMVYAAMGDAMQKDIHALSIQALTPDEAA